MDGRVLAIFDTSGLQKRPYTKKQEKFAWFSRQAVYDIVCIQMK